MTMIRTGQSNCIKRAQEKKSEISSDSRIGVGVGTVSFVSVLSFLQDIIAIRLNIKKIKIPKFKILFFITIIIIVLHSN